MTAICVFGQLTPTKDEDIVSKKPLWNPLDDLEVRDPFSRKIRCLGIKMKNVRCRWDSDDHTIHSRAPQIEQLLISLSQKSPHDVTEYDLRELLELCLCEAHQNCEHSATQKGLVILEKRLAAAKANSSKSSMEAQWNHQITELQNKMFHASIEALKYQSQVSNIEKQLGEKTKECDSWCLFGQKEAAKSHYLQAQISRLIGEVQKLKSTIESLTNSSAEKDNVIHSFHKQAADTTAEIEKLVISNNEKYVQLVQIEKQSRERETELKQTYDKSLAERQSEHDTLLETHSGLHNAYEKLREEHRVHILKYEKIQEQYTVTEARAVKNEMEVIQMSHQIKALEEVRQHQQQDIERLGEEYAVQKSSYDDLSNSYEKAVSQNETLSAQLQAVCVEKNALTAENEVLAGELKALSAKKSKKWLSLPRFLSHG